MHVLNLGVHLERLNLLISGGKPTDTPANILDWYKMGIATKLRKIIKKEITKKKKNKTKQNGKSPGTGFLSWLGPHSRYNALPTELRGTCHAWKENLKIIGSEWSTNCKEQVHKDYAKNGVFWLQIGIAKKALLFDLKILKFSCVSMHVLNLRVHFKKVNLQISGRKPWLM